MKGTLAWNGLIKCSTQSEITCSNLTIEPLEHMVWNMFKVNNKDIKTTPMASFWCLYCKLWTYFTPCSSVSMVNFEHVNAGRVNETDWIIAISINKETINNYFVVINTILLRVFEGFWYTRVNSRLLCSIGDISSCF